MPPWKSDLHRSNLEFLKDGRSGKIYRTGYKLRFDPTELAYKEYEPSVPGGAWPKRGAAAEKAVRFRDTLRVGRDDLDRYFAWPREVVRDDATGEICGFLMPLAYPDFFWQEGKPRDQLRTLDWLTTTETSWRVNQVDLFDVVEADRLFLMVQLAYAVALLHKDGWVFGDLSFTNAAFALYPPRLMLFGCDHAAELADQNREQGRHTHNWHPPEFEGHRGQRQQDFATDVYKLGLAIVRGLKPGVGATTTRDAGRLTGILDPDGIELLTRALSADRNARPSAEDLFNYLKRVTEPRLVEPQIKSAELATSLVMRGANARILWQIKNAEEIQVFLGENPPQLVRHVTPANSPGGCAFAVTQPGQVTVVARNRYGTAKRVAGDVTLYGPPSVLEGHRPVQRPVFVSYVRDDAHRIDRICEALSAAEVSYWRDLESLLPGTRWRHEIREAIRSGNAFLAFFSSSSENRDRSFMREELRIAVEELRLRPRNRPWFIPIRLDFCEVPAIDIGGGELLSDLHYMDLFEANEQDGIARLIATIERLGTR